MISRLNSVMPFEGTSPSTPREGYDFLINNNNKTAQNQNNLAMNIASILKLGPIPMQGTGQKLDIIA
ncbi:MAG: hypothetical protein IKL52_02410 [Candidatus Gastranaerophilales bacterium]|jgi:hypothetical protein|nr:hypothetical protein [Candidatus Gastranaerophilales bacterium]